MYAFFINLKIAFDSVNKAKLQEIFKKKRCEKD